ncbi:MAG: Lin0512 family protein [Paracoccaceae bacterium]
MTEQRLIIEMGQGIDLHGKDATKAARRAVEDAMRGSSLPIFGSTGLNPKDMRVQVTVAVPTPSDVDCDAVAKTLPYGSVSVRAVQGGMQVPARDDPVLMAMASVEVFLPKQTGWKIR